MKRSIVVSSLGLLGSIGFLGYTTSVAHRQEQQLQTLHQRSSQLQNELISTRREHDAVAREVQEAERQLASIPTPATTAGAVEIAAERRAEMANWLKRVKRLKQLFDERPDQRVPEMKYLTDQDWLKVAKRVDLEAENGERKAFAAIRDAAAGHFTPQLSEALRKFATSSGDSAPPPMSVFARFLDPTADPEMLDRYEIIKTTEPYEKAQRWRVQTKAAIDADYDSRHYVDAYVDGRGHGGGSTGAPWAWIPDFRSQTERAHRAFTAANKGTSATGLADVLPYFNPPLSPALIEKLIKAEREQKR